MAYQDLWRRWTPDIGMADIANVLVNQWLSDFPAIQKSPVESAHVMGAAFSLFGLARHGAIGRQNPTFVEIGTQVGLSTRVLLTVAHMTNGRLISMDIDPSCGEGKTREWAKKNDFEKRWTFIGKPSQECDVTPNADFLLVDGDHGYEAVCSDMARHGVAVRPGGVIVLDDYHQSFPGKVRWVQERWRELAPLTIGPHAVLVKLPGDDEIYTKKYVTEASWNWSL